MRDIDHFFGDDAGAGEFELGDQRAVAARAARAWRGMARRALRGDVAVVFGLDRAALVAFPARRGGRARFRAGRQAGAEIDGGGRLRIGTGRVVNPQRRLAAGGSSTISRKGTRMSAAGGRDIDLAGAGRGPVVTLSGVRRSWNARSWNGRSSRALPLVFLDAGRERPCRPPSLRWHYPDQVYGFDLSRPVPAAPLGLNF